MKQIEGTSLQGSYDCYLATAESITDMELATVEDWLSMMLKHIRARRKVLCQSKIKSPS